MVKRIMLDELKMRMWSCDFKSKAINQAGQISKLKVVT